MGHLTTQPNLTESVVSVPRSSRGKKKSRPELHQRLRSRARELAPTAYSCKRANFRALQEAKCIFERVLGYFLPHPLAGAHIQPRLLPSVSDVPVLPNRPGLKAHFPLLRNTRKVLHNPGQARLRHVRKTA